MHEQSESATGAALMTSSGSSPLLMSVSARCSPSPSVCGAAVLKVCCSLGAPAVPEQRQLHLCVLKFTCRFQPALQSVEALVQHRCNAAPDCQ